MKKWNRMAWSIAIVGGWLLTSSAFAQRGSGGMQNRFEDNSPAIGQRLPDVTVYDEDGEPFAVRDLKGQYSVIVFGCLT